MAKVIKLKDRQGNLVLPLTRSQLVQVSQIVGLPIPEGQTWTWDKASVQNALEALYSYTSSQGADQSKEIELLKSYLSELITMQKTVVTYVNEEDAKVHTDAYNYVDAREEAIKTAYEAADTAIITGYTEADTAIITGYTNADTAIITGYTEADSAIISSYEAADEALGDRIDALDATYTVETGKVFTEIVQTDGLISSVTTAYLNAEDIKTNNSYYGQDGDLETALNRIHAAIETGGDGSKVSMREVSTGLDSGVLKAYEIYQGDDGSYAAAKKVGTINIPKDFLVKSGEVKTVTTADQPYEGAVVGDKYLDFVINTVGDDETAQHMYIPVKDLTDVYTGETWTSGETTTQVDVDGSNGIWSYLTSVDSNIVKHNNKTLSSYLSDYDTHFSTVDDTLTAHQNDLTSYNTRIETLEDKAAALSYVIDGTSSYITVNTTTNNGVTTFTYSTQDIASAATLDALQDELTSYGVFFTDTTQTVADTTLFD